MKGQELKRQRGFTLVELILVMVLIGAIFAVGSIILLRALDSYQYTTERAALLERSRYCVDRVVREFQLLGTGDLTNVGATSIQFVDDLGNNTSFNLNGTDLRRGNDVLCSNVTNLAFTCYNSTGGVTGSAVQTRRLRIDLTVQGGGTAGTVVLRGEAFMRGMMYDGYL